MLAERLAMDRSLHPLAHDRPRRAPRPLAGAEDLPEGQPPVAPVARALDAAEQRAVRRRVVADELVADDVAGVDAGDPRQAAVVAQGPEPVPRALRVDQAEDCAVGLGLRQALRARARAALRGG